MVNECVEYVQFEDNAAIAATSESELISTNADACKIVRIAKKNQVNQNLSNLSATKLHQLHVCMPNYRVSKKKRPKTPDVSFSVN